MLSSSGIFVCCTVVVLPPSGKNPFAISNKSQYHIAPRSSCVNRRFGGTYHLRKQEEGSWFLARLIFDPEDGYADYTMLYSRK
jgi:hypothetical protein